MLELGDAIADTKYRDEDLQPIAEEMWELLKLFFTWQELRYGIIFPVV